MTDTAREMTYPLTGQLNFSFSPYEDRLLVRADRGSHGPVLLLVSRRMTMVMLRQLLARLPEVTGLDKTPAQYWRDVLQMKHEQAMQSRRDEQADADNAQAAFAGDESGGDESAPEDDKPREAPAIFLATELVLRLQDRQLLLAFNGLPMPQAMTQNSEHQPVLAIHLEARHVHQWIELLIDKARDADWHLPVELPWLKSPEPPRPTTLGH